MEWDSHSLHACSAWGVQGHDPPRKILNLIVTCNNYINYKNLEHYIFLEHHILNIFVYFKLSELCYASVKNDRLAEETSWVFLHKALYHFGGI